MLTYLVLLCLSVSALAAGPCDTDADKFYKCMGETKRGSGPQGEHKQGGPDNRAAFEETEKKRTACFTDKGCKVPAREEKGKGPDGKNGGKGKEDFATMKKCIEGAVEKVKACVGPTHFPEPPKEDVERDLGAEKRHGGSEKGPGGPQGVDPRARAGADCPAATAVNQCLDALKPPQKESESHEHGHEKGGDWAQKFAAECQTRKDAEQKCAALMTPACQKSLTDTKKVVCDCGNKQKADFVSCIGPDGEKHFNMFLHEVCETKCDAQGAQGGPPHKA